MFLPYLLCTNASAVEDAMIQRGQDVIPALWAGSSQSDVGTAANWLYRVMNCLVGHDNSMPLRIPLWILDPKGTCGVVGTVGETWMGFIDER